MKISIILGTRPEIIKMSPIIRECDRRGLHYSILHTGQHYAYNMDRVFFEQLKLPEANHNLDVGSGKHGEQTGKMLVRIEEVLIAEQPDIVLVEGDTNTVLAGALAAAKLHIKGGHVEAGLRSYDRKMPEEINRVLTDHCADYLFAPTIKAAHILQGEGIKEERIFVTGNTIVDAVLQNQQLSKQKVTPLNELGLTKQEYLLMTAHRQENVDMPERLRGIFKGLQQVGDELEVPIVYPIHPRAKKMMQRFDIEPDNIMLIDPVDYLSFLQLEQHAQLVLTDSGGVQEEACILKVPCVTLRDNTERPETLDVHSNILAGTRPSDIVEAARTMLNRENRWENPFGDGTAAKQIIDIVTRDG